MRTLTRAHTQLFRRTPDEQFATLAELHEHCCDERDAALTGWRAPEDIKAVASEEGLELYTGNCNPLAMNDWSFGQLCGLAGVGKDTVNKLKPDTARRVFEDALPRDGKPLQIYSVDGQVRSIHRASYTRVPNADLLETVLEFSTEFQAPQEGYTGGSGLYCGEQDLFCFLVDPLGWTEIGSQSFAPGFFLWNSEVGRRTIGVQTFWFQAVCQNHLVWDAVEVVEFSRKHTTNVGESRIEIQRIVERLAKRRDERKDGFYRVMQKAMAERLGDSADDVLPLLQQHGIAKSLAAEALKSAQATGALTIFSVVDALTRLSAQTHFAGDRTESDAKAGRLLQLAA